MATSRVDDAALRALYAEHGTALLGYATRLCGGDRGRAEDVVQETLLRAWQHPDSLTPERGSVRAWLFTVAHHLAVDAHRARSARPTEIGPASLDHLSVDDDVDRALDSWLVADALATLTDAHRAVVLETFYRGCSVAEAATRLGVPQGTVKSRAYYALRALRVALAERGVQS